ncbi:MAG: hypothetical protein IJ604_01795 [Prevotella sp.]|nr:hypothetical protein [Prevotella sp.]MBR1462099.1 hypothetical protein [Prevotella sp.]
MTENIYPLNLKEKAKKEETPGPSAGAEEPGESSQTPADPEEPSEKAATKKENAADMKEKQEPTLQEAFKEQAREDERPQSSTFTLRKILGGDWLTADFIRRQIGVILLIVGLSIVYISNRYSCQKDMLEIDKLNAELTDAKYKALSSSSELTEKCRESNVLDLLKSNKDSLLRIANQPPYIIYIP